MVRIFIGLYILNEVRWAMGLDAIRFPFNKEGKAKLEKAHPELADANRLWDQDGKIYMTKIKTDAYLERLKVSFGDRWSEYWEQPFGVLIVHGLRQSSH